MQTQRVVLTYQDYAELPDDGRRYELHEGELSVTPAPGRRHQATLRNLNEVLWQLVKSRGLGELYFALFDCILDETTVVQPDLVFVDTDHLEVLSERGAEGPPTLVVEIISPHTGRIDRVRKLQLYARYHIPFYWIVDPDARTVEAYRLAGDSYERAGRATHAEPSTLPPFEDLTLVPTALLA